MEMLFLLMELDDCIMTLFLFQEQYGIHLRVEEPKKGCQRTSQGARKVDLC